jgi:hypothetical protein
MSNDSTEIVTRPNGNGAIQRHGFGSTEIEHRQETQSTAIAARAQAEIQARYIVALQRPRDLATVRQRVLEHCKRKGFADKAEYAKPIGRDKVRGPTIRFVETALQEFGNVLPETTVYYDDREKRCVRVSVTDLERNVTYSGDIVVEKTIEKKNPKDGDEILSSRRNSYDEIVFTVTATSDEVSVKQGAAESKKLRTLGLRILPADLVEEWMQACAKTRNEGSSDPAAARKAAADAFSALGVAPAQIGDYLGRPLDEATPADIADLKLVYTALAEREATWAELMSAKRTERGEGEEKATSPAATKVREALDKARNRKSVVNAKAKDEAPAEPK